MMDILAQWPSTRWFVALVLGAELVMGVFLWYGPLVLDRPQVERLRPLAIGLIAIAAALALVGVIAGGGAVLSLLAVLALAYVAYTWSDDYLDRLDSTRIRSAGGSRLGRWRWGVERGPIRDD
jgi:hypothetical protein